VGEASLGSDPACAITIAGPGVLPRHAVLQGQSDGQVIIRKATPAAEILINGVRLGAEPIPLLHGDKIDIGGNELTYVDERRSGGSTAGGGGRCPPGAGATPFSLRCGGGGGPPPPPFRGAGRQPAAGRAPALTSLGPSGASAWRRRASQTHPSRDRIGCAAPP